MNRRQILQTGGLVSLGLLSGCSSFLEQIIKYEEDKILRYRSEIEKIKKAIYLVHTETTFKFLDGEKKGEEYIKKSTGLATAIKEDLLLTVDHVVSEYELQPIQTPFGIVFPPAVERVNEVTYLDEGSFRPTSEEPRRHKLEDLISDRENDIALFKSPLKLNFYPFVPCTTPYEGMKILLFGYPHFISPTIIEGQISSLNPKIIGNFNPENKFLMNITLNLGDSGGIIIHKDDYRLVGLAQGKFNLEGIAFGIKADVAFNIIKPYLK